LATSELLSFQLAHGRARDAVHAALQPAPILAALRELTSSRLLPDSLLLHSAARDRRQYLQRPDLGRRLEDASRDRLTSLRAVDSPSREYDLSIVLADGLSALAVERHALPVLAKLLPALEDAAPSWRLAPLCIVQQGRVAVGDEVGELLNATLVLVLIGERPGLSSPDSLGAYITWRPHPGRTDAERNCVSNIRTDGLEYPEAAARLLHLITAARRNRLTGVALKDSSQLLEPGQ
jgi:ethanolamine ammonia-lyase small subunit